ncbi:septation protein SepH [Propionibacteriaceae bacterium Y1923]
MDSALSPREIQARIRGGESLAAVAEAAGVPEDQIEPFAAPVVAEREHVLGQALACPVRRKGESSSARALRHVVAEGLRTAGLDEADLTWDAWRDPERHWVVVATHGTDDSARTAHFRFDLRGRFSIARDDWARELIGEPSPTAAPVPVRTPNPDDEPTVGLEGRSETIGQDTAAPGPEFPARPIPQPIEQVQVDEDPGLSLEAAQDDLVGHASQLDVLYDMLSSFDEDSVNVYADLSRPVVDDDLDYDLLNQVTDDEQEPDEPAPAKPAGIPDSVNPAELELEDTNPVETGQPEKPLTEPEQDPLVDVDEPPAPKPKPRSRKSRASIPSWDEIVFGGPKPQD